LHVLVKPRAGPLEVSCAELGHDLSVFTNHDINIGRPLRTPPPVTFAKGRDLGRVMRPVPRVKLHQELKGDGPPNLGKLDRALKRF